MVVNEYLCSYPPVRGSKASLLQHHRPSCSQISMHNKLQFACIIKPITASTGNAAPTFPSPLPSWAESEQRFIVGLLQLGNKLQRDSKSSQLSCFALSRTVLLSVRPPHISQQSSPSSHLLRQHYHRSVKLIPPSCATQPSS
jgi:hypothetical protein